MRAILAITLIWVAGLGAAAQYGKVSIVYDRLGAIWPDAGGALAFAVSLVGFVGVLLGVVAGLIVARAGYKRALVAGLGLGAAVSLLESSLPAFPVFLTLRVIEGMSHLLIVVAAPTLIAQVAPDAWRGAALTLWGSFFGVAFSLLVWLGLPLADWGGVAMLFAAHGIYMGGAALVVGLVLPADPARRPDGALNLRDLVQGHLNILRSPYLVAPAAGWVFYTFTFVSLLTLLPPHIPPEWRIFVIAAIPMVSILSSLTIGVALLARMKAVSVVIIGFIMSAGFAACLVLWPGDPLLCMGLAAGFGLVQGASFAAVAQLNSADSDRALANGGLAVAGNLGNTLGTPVLAAVGLGLGYGAMMGLAALLLMAGAVLHLVLARRRLA